jgi:predicted nucleic acid-binding protein
MDIIYPAALIPTLKNKHLLLDTNIFRDVAIKPTVFHKFFSELKQAEVTLVTIDLVKYEILKGSSDKNKYIIKEKLINDVTDITVPIRPDTLQLVYQLIKSYGINGSAVHITDLILGAILMQYKKNIYLITRDTSDFIQEIFDLKFIVNATHNKGIFTYGVYQYTK